jgi:hypothetical protein
MDPSRTPPRTPPELDTLTASDKNAILLRYLELFPTTQLALDSILLVSF